MLLSATYTGRILKIVIQNPILHIIEITAILVIECFFEKPNNIRLYVIDGKVCSLKLAARILIGRAVYRKL